MIKKKILLCCVISVSRFNRTMADVLRNVTDKCRGVFIGFFFSRNVYSPVVSALDLFSLNFPSNPPFSESPRLVFFNWMTRFTFDIYLSQIVRKCVHIPRNPRAFLASFPFIHIYKYKYIQYIYTMFC